jgi:hypothetical protein
MIHTYDLSIRYNECMHILEKCKMHLRYIHINEKDKIIKFHKYIIVI